MGGKCKNCSFAHFIGSQITCDLKHGMPVSPADWEYLNCREFEARGKLPKSAACVSKPATVAVEVERGDSLGSLFLKCGTFSTVPQIEEEEGWI